MPRHAAASLHASHLTILLPSARARRSRRPRVLVTVKPRSSHHRPSPAGAAAPPAEAPLPFSEYLTSSDPDKRQRAENWRFAIGLQRVDGLSVSPFLVELARKNIEGLMTNEEVQLAVRAHYSKQPKSPNP